jgi:hypothetical protein
MFKYPASDLRRATQMHQDCPHCGFHFEIEPGFFWGAMYISYAFSVAVSVTFGFLCSFVVVIAFEHAVFEGSNVVLVWR